MFQNLFLIICYKISQNAVLGKHIADISKVIGVKLSIHPLILFIIHYL